MENESVGLPSRSIQKGSGRGRARPRVLVAIVAVIIVGVAVMAVLSLNPPEVVRVDGSSTVYPITAAWAAEFSSGGRQVTVAFSGTGGGFQKFCRGEIDLSDASRPIKTSERTTCEQNGITGITEFKVAYDGLSIVVHKDNTWVDHLTVRQLCRIWTSNTSADACGGAGPRAERWNELNASWPSQAITLFGPGTDSGTYDYFLEAVLAPYKTGITPDFTASENDNLLVFGVANDQYALGYFGYAYVVENLDKLRPVAIDDEEGTDGPILPSESTIRDGTYTPLSRPLFVYANAKSLDRPIVRDFLRFGYGDRGTALIADTGYVALTPSEIAVEVGRIPA